MKPIPTQCVIPCQPLLRFSPTPHAPTGQVRSAPSPVAGGAAPDLMLISSGNAHPYQCCSGESRRCLAPAAAPFSAVLVQAVVRTPICPRGPLNRSGLIYESIDVIN